MEAGTITNRPNDHLIGSQTVDHHSLHDPSTRPFAHTRYNRMSLVRKAGPRTTGSPLLLHCSKYPLPLRHSDSSPSSTLLYKPNRSRVEMESYSTLRLFRH